MFKFHWSVDSRRFFSTIGFLLILCSSFQLAIKLTELCFPAAKALSYSMLNNKQKIAVFRSANKNENWIGLTLLFCIAITVVLPFVGYFKIATIYERNQLINHGQVQKVFIHGNKKIQKSTYALFRYFINGKTYESYLLKKEWLQVGDSSTIIFSTDNKDIVQWADDFKSQENR